MQQHNNAIIKVGAVSYCNTKPMITGLLYHESIDLVVDYPANIATMLLNNTIDIGLVPVTVIPQLPQHYLVSNYGIGTIGKVTSVCVYSKVPMEQIETILLDYQSNTSVQLLKILLQEYWHKTVALKPATIGYEQLIAGTTAALIIGDRAFYHNTQHPYIYDLSEAWYKHTQLPFIFARWVANKNLGINTEAHFIQAIGTNLYRFKNTDAYKKMNTTEQYYIANYIQYNLTTPYNKGMELFLSKVSIE